MSAVAAGARGPGRHGTGGAAPTSDLTTDRPPGPKVIPVHPARTATVTAAPLVSLGTALLCAAAALAGCGGSSTPADVGSPSTSSTSTGAGTGRPPHPPLLRLDARSDRTTVDVFVGQGIEVVLDGVQWSIAPPSPGASLRTVTAPSAVASRCTPVGSGCGTTSERLTAVAAGTSVLTAHRDSCGEALACTGRRGDWQVTVVVR